MVQYPVLLNLTLTLRSMVNNGVVTDAYKVWKIHDKALMTLITATLSTTALSCVIGCTSSQQMWTNLCERFANMTRTNIVQLKIDLQNIQKGTESIDAYMQRIKDARDRLATVGVLISDEDIVIVALRGLSSEYNTIKAIIRGRENLVSLQELRSQLKAEEVILAEVPKQVPLLSAMLAQSSSSVYDTGGPSGTKSVPAAAPLGGFHNFPVAPLPQVPFQHSYPQMQPFQHSYPQMQPFQQLPFSQLPLPDPYAFVAHTGSGSYNNFKANNFKPKGKGKKFHFGGNNSPQQSLYGGNTFLSSPAICFIRSRVSTTAKMPNL